jgi:hypothetical protein
MVDASWRQESIGVLLWALSIVDDLPPYDRQFENVAGRIPLLEAVDVFLRDAQLRTRTEIEHARDLAELWHWRSRSTQLQSRPDFAETHPDIDLNEIVTRAATHAHDQGDIPAPIDRATAPRRRCTFAGCGLGASGGALDHQQPDLRREDPLA